MQKTIRRLKASAAGRRGASTTWLIPLLLASTSHAAPSGMAGTLYYGSLPPDVQVACVENQTCSVRGVQEVWYGANGSWIYKLMDGVVACNNATFTDPAPGKFKACYSHDITTPEILPPTVDTIPLTFELNDLLTKSKGRFSFAVWDGGERKPITTNRLEINLKANKGPLRLQQNFFQFDITDGGSPIRQHNIYISPTYNRCLVSHLSSTGNVVNTPSVITGVESLAQRTRAVIGSAATGLMSACWCNPALGGGRPTRSIVEDPMDRCQGNIQTLNDVVPRVKYFPSDGWEVTNK